MKYTVIGSLIMDVAFFFLLKRETAGNKTKQMFSLADILL